MDFVTLDFETFYGDGYTLSSMTTEAYVRDPRFESILCSFKVNKEKAYWVPRDDIPAAFRDLRLERRAVICHHAHFDGLIMAHHYGVSPKLFIDTLGMARAIFGANAKLSLAKLAERLGMGVKGTEVLNARNMRFADFGIQQLQRYGRYSCNDSDITNDIAEWAVPQFSMDELAINDQVIRMFTEPVFVMDTAMLEAYANQLRGDKLAFLMRAGVQIDDVMSNEKFANCLLDLGVAPPMKVSPSWLKKSEAEREPTPPLTYAFAKTDSGIQALQEHPDERVQALVEARLKNKTTIAERGAMRLIGMAERGRATVYLKYSGASGTHRLSGGDKFNWQSMKRGSDLRNATMAPPGHKVIVSDSSTIEARLLDWLAGQDDMVQVYRDADAGTGPDMYCIIGGRIYKRPITKADDPDERQMGKVAKLGLGFGMGVQRFIISVRGQAKNAEGKPLVLTQDFAKNVVDIYREAHPQVKKLWKRGDSALASIAAGAVGVALDYRGIVKTCKDGLVFPGGLKILYPDLRKVKSQSGVYEFEWEFWNGRNRERIYGAKLIENVIQCLARIVVFKQCLDTARELKGEARWAHSMHDEGVFVAPDFAAPYALEVLMRNMRTPPAFAPDLPLNCEGGFHQRYGKAKK